MSSLDGTDMIGPFFLSRFLRKVSEVSESDVEMSYLLNNYRILVIPTANVLGFYSNKKEEKTAKGKLVDVELDFNYGIISDQKRCFQSTTARILAHIFKVIIKSIWFKNKKGYFGETREMVYFAKSEYV